MRRFTFWRENIKVLEGVVMTSGVVFIQWFGKVNSFGHYVNLDEFKEVHINNHEKKGTIYFQDNKAEEWHCFACGTSGLIYNFCEMCGSPSTAFSPAMEGFEISERWLIEKELAVLNARVHHAIYQALSPEQWQVHKALAKRLKEIELDGYIFKPSDPIDKKILENRLAAIAKQVPFNEREFSVEAIRKNVVERLEKKK